MRTKLFKNILDLTQTVEPGMPVYPGTPPVFFKPTGTIKEDGYRELLITLQTHTGTHIDTPAHIYEYGKSLSNFETECFIGSAIVLEHSVNKPLSVVKILELQDQISSVDFVLVNTNWDKHWNSPRYFDDFPVPAPEVFHQLVALVKRGIGIDAISIDAVGDANLPNHHTVLGNELIIIENLTNLAALVDKGIVTFSCLPLAIKDGDGSPVRAIALFD